MTEEEANNYLKEKYPHSNWQDGIVRDVNNWNRFVHEIANGAYDGTIDEYYNDLDTRLTLNEVGFDNDPRVKVADDIFRPLLICNEMRIWGYVENREDDWWNFGYPKTVNDELKKEFELSYSIFLKERSRAK